MAQHPPQPHVHAQIRPLLLMEGNNRYVLIPNTFPEGGIVGETHDCMAIPRGRYAVNHVHQPIFQTAYRKPMNDMHNERGLPVPRLYSVGPRHTDIRIYDHVHPSMCLSYAVACATTISRNSASRRALCSSHWWCSCT